MHVDDEESIDEAIIEGKGLIVGLHECGLAPVERLNEFHLSNKVTLPVGVCDLACVVSLPRDRLTLHDQQQMRDQLPSARATELYTAGAR